MPTVERIETWRGQDVLDSAGEKAGRLEEVYYDSTAQEPVLFAVKHGMLGRQVALVPAGEAVLSHDYVRVPYSVEQIQHSETGSVEDELTGEQVAAVGVLFNLTLAVSDPVYSASLIQRRRVDAEKADQRARELELEAQKRAEELEEARRRAGTAADEADAAEREREKAQADAATFEPGRESPPSP